MYDDGQFEQSYSEVAETREKIWRKGVLAKEFDADSWMWAPRLIVYTSEVMQSLPALLQSSFPTLRLSPRVHGHKLAVSIGAGAYYPKHLDNSVNADMDQRKLTAIYYMNQDWDTEKNGGELRLFCSLDEANPYVDIAPEADRLVLFWSDLIPHEVMPCWDEAASSHRYTFTMWLTSENPEQIANKKDPLYSVRQKHFPSFDTSNTLQGT